MTLEEINNQLLELQKEYKNLFRDYSLVCKENANLKQQLSKSSKNKDNALLLSNQQDLATYIAAQGYTTEEWKKCADELCQYGATNGHFEDDYLVSLVIGWLYRFEQS